MDKICEIEELYFQKKFNVVEIADKLSVSKQYVSKVLKGQFNDKYNEEKETRKLENQKKRNKVKSSKLKQKRKMHDPFNDVTVDDLRREQELSAMSMSERSRLTTKAVVYACLNAYDVKKNNLVYNDKVGRKPADIPKRFSLDINIWRE